jgi:hypothetical protein
MTSLDQDKCEVQRVYKCPKNDVDVASTKASLDKKALMIVTAFVVVSLVATVGLLSFDTPTSTSHGNSGTSYHHGAQRRLASSSCPLSASFDYISPTIDHLCLDAPTLFEMQYLGGSCSLSLQQTVPAMACTDHNGGPGDRESVYIIATSSGALLYSGTVTNHGSFYLYNKEELLPTPARIEIYDNVERGTLLQDVTFDSSCAEPNVIGNVFGASRMTGFMNEEQGSVNRPDIQTTATPPGQVTVSLSSSPSNSIAVIDSISITTDFNEPATFSYPPMSGAQVGSQPVEASFEASLYYPIKYTTTVSVAATVDGGEACEFSVTHVYENGN